MLGDVAALPTDPGKSIQQKGKCQIFQPFKQSVSYNRMLKCYFLNSEVSVCI